MKVLKIGVPWFALSPSPFSIAFYLILIVYTYRKIACYGHSVNIRDKIVFWTDAFFIVGFFIVFLDSFWILASWIRFGAAYPESAFQLAASFGRNMAAIILCYLIAGVHLQRINPSRLTFTFFYLDVFFLAAWFYVAPNPSLTDWTFAIRHGYPASRILTAFLISHIIGKIIAAGFYLSLWKK